MPHVPLILAYLDPRAGSLLMQLVLGGAAGILVAFRVLGSRFTADHGACWNPGCRQRYRPLTAVEPSLARIPMMIRSPDYAPRIIDDDYQHVDLLTTLLEILGLPAPPPEAIDGRSALSHALPRRPRPFFVNDGHDVVELELPPRRVELTAQEAGKRAKPLREAQYR